MSVFTLIDTSPVCVFRIADKIEHQWFHSHFDLLPGQHCKGHTLPACDFRVADPSDHKGDADKEVDDDEDDDEEQAVDSKNTSRIGTDTA
jgi:hypothetical protein